MHIFDIIGPIMIGPSSSHTAGAVRIGKTARKILSEQPVRAEIGLTGSFATTYKGHGTDKALIAGILGMSPDDERIRSSFSIAQEAGLTWNIYTTSIAHAHPNTAEIVLTGASGAQCSIQGASVGGGNITVTRIGGMETAFSGAQDTLIIPHHDKPGTIAAVTALVADLGMNIGSFRLSRQAKGFSAVMTIEIDGAIESAVIHDLKALPNVISVVHLPAI